MITRDNLNDVIALITPKDIKRIVNTDKEYCYLELFITNSITKVFVTLTDKACRYMSKAASTGNALFTIEDTIELINENSNKLSVMQEYQRIGGLI